MTGVRLNAPSLRQLQEWMAARLLGPARGDLVDTAELDAWLWAPSPARVADRLHVYAGGYSVRVHDALADAYPALARAAGEAAFRALAERYASAVPLTSYNLNDAGAAMARFLSGDVLAERCPWAPALAELEWRVWQAFHAPEAQPLDAQALGWSTERWAVAVLQFHPSVAVYTSEWPLLELWSAAERLPPSALERLDQPQRLVVHRAAGVVRCELVSRAEARALELMLDRQPLADVAALLEAERIEPDTVVACFSRWIHAGMIVGAE